MKVSSKTDYALRTVLDLAMREDDGVTKASSIAKRQSIPLKFLEQILLALRSGGIVASRRGARGGYFLAKAASDISLGEIVRLTEDGLVTRSASKRPGGGLGFGLNEDPFAPIWKSIEANIDGTLGGISISDMRENVHANRQDAVQDYSI